MRLRVEFLVLIILLSGLFTPEATAQSGNHPFVIHYDKQTYGGENQNWSVSCSEDGTSYFGNNRGLLEFDGSNWRTHPMPAKGIVRSVLAAEGNRIYVGSFEEFGFFEKEVTGQLSYHSLSDLLTPEDQLHNDEIWRIVLHGGKYYFQSFSSLLIYDGRQIELVKPGASLVLLMQVRNRLFVHLVGKGLHEIDETSFSLIEGSEKFADEEIKVMLPFGEKDFLVGVNGHGLYVWDQQSFTVLAGETNELMHPWEFNNARSDEQRMIIGTIGKGLFLLNKNAEVMSHLHSGNQLHNNTILGICIDHFSNIWTALDKGIDLVNFSTLLDIHIDPSEQMGAVYAAAADGENLLIGTNQGLYRYQFDPVKGFADPVLVENMTGQIWDLRVIQDRVICGHNNGTSIIERNSVRTISEIRGGYQIRKYPGGDQTLWLQSSYSSLVFYSERDGQLNFLHAVNGFYEPITSFEVDHLGYIWCGHATRGLFRLKLSSDLKKVDEIRYFGKDQGLDPDTRIRVAEIKNRVIFLNGRTILSFDDMQDRIVPHSWLNDQLGGRSSPEHIIPAGPLKYWFINENETALVQVEGVQLNTEFVYDASLFGLFINKPYAGIFPIGHNRQLIGLDNGFALYDPDLIHKIPEKQSVRFTEIKCSKDNGEVVWMPLPVGGQVKVDRIDYNRRNLYFAFSANNGYKNPQYCYKLSGLSEQWTDWSSESETNFYRLPSGEYTLEVKAKNLAMAEDSILAYHFRIKAPWFLSVPALALYGLFIAFGAILLRILFLRRLKSHKKKIEEEINLKRTQEKLEAEKEMIRHKNENLQQELKFKNVQLSDYAMGIIHKNEHLNKIKRELARYQKDDAGLIPSPAKEKIVKMIEEQISSDDEWQRFETHFEQTHQDFLKRLKTAYPQITQSDLKLSAYLRLNISSKQIAKLLNISIRGVEVRRYRLRKRLNLSTKENLYEFLLKF